MRFYLIDSGGGWYATLTEAHATGKQTPEVYRADLRIYEMEVDTDKANILRMLSGEQPTFAKTGRIWTLTHRGGLKEITG